MKQFFKNTQTRFKDFWKCNLPAIVDFTIIGLLGFWIYWVLWREKPIEKMTDRTEEFFKQQVDTVTIDRTEEFFKQP